MKAHSLKVSPNNSTVNGYPPRADHDAREWTCGWINLDFENPAAYIDGEPLCGGQYLHIPLANDEGRCVYRVRCKYRPGMKYRGKTVVSVGALKLHVWRWIIRTGGEV